MTPRPVHSSGKSAGGVSAKVGIEVAGAAPERDTSGKHWRDSDREHERAGTLLRSRQPGSSLGTPVWVGIGILLVLMAFFVGVDS